MRLFLTHVILQQRSSGWWCVANVEPGEVSCEHGERIEKDAHSINAVHVADPEWPLMATIISLVDPTSRLENKMEASWGGSRSLLDPDGDGSTLVRKVPVSSGSILHLFLLVSRYLAKSMHIRGIRSAFSPARIKCLSISGFQPFKVARFPKYDALSMPLV